MISSLYNLTLPHLNEEWHQRYDIVARKPGRHILDGDTGHVPNAPDRLIYKISIKEYSLLNICVDEFNLAVIQSFISWKETAHQLVWEGVLYAYREYWPHFVRVGMDKNAVPVEKLRMPPLPVWMVTLVTPNIGLLHEFPSHMQLIETLNNLEVSVAWTVLVDYAEGLNDLSVASRYT
jgi:hypothetical protein